MQNAVAKRTLGASMMGVATFCIVHLLRSAISLEIGSIAARRGIIGAAASWGATCLVSPPTHGYWQLWRPDDMLEYVDRYGRTGDAESILAAMDKCAETSWMMNMGPAKGELVEAAFRDRRRVLEIGTFLGYMTIRIARSMGADARLTTIEKDDTNYDVARRIMARALPDSTMKRVRTVHAAARDVIADGKRSLIDAPFDAVLLDHWKSEYRRDLELLASSSLLAPGALVVADNVLFPGAPDYLDYLSVDYARTSDPATGQPCLTLLPPSDRDQLPVSWKSRMFETRLLSVPFEYRPETPDAMSFSTFIGRNQ